MIKFREKAEIYEWVKTQSMNNIVDNYVDLIWERQERTEKIIITEAQFKEFFRIRGRQESGEIETRGRKSLRTVQSR